ncbi:hypothetical protein V6N13_124123 [Hibiscus sabdariffa]
MVMARLEWHLHEGPCDVSAAKVPSNHACDHSARLVVVGDDTKAQSSYAHSFACSCSVGGASMAGCCLVYA